MRPARRYISPQEHKDTTYDNKPRGTLFLAPFRISFVWSIILSIVYVLYMLKVKTQKTWEKRIKKVFSYVVSLR